MKQFSCVLMAILVATAMAGCNPNTLADTYDVMFDKQPLLSDDGVYLKGNRIGTVVSNAPDTSPIGRLAISIDSPFRDMMRTNTTFFISSGKLEMASLGRYGEPLTQETKLLGFGSKAALIWFKTRYLLKNQTAAAAKKAEQLYQRVAS